MAGKWGKVEGRRRRFPPRSLATSPKSAGVLIGFINGISKKLWEYQWVGYADAEDTGSNAVLPVCLALAHADLSEQLAAGRTPARCTLWPALHHQPATTADDRLPDGA